MERQSMSVVLLSDSVEANSDTVEIIAILFRLMFLSPRLFAVAYFIQ